MTAYRIYFLGFDGHLLGAESVACESDAEAVAAARRTLRTYAAVEVWSGNRKLEHLEASPLFGAAEATGNAPTNHG